MFFKEIFDIMFVMVDVGDDEFCTDCMEWRKYDEEGKCVVCGKLIFKKPAKKETSSYAEYEKETFESEETEY